MSRHLFKKARRKQARAEIRAIRKSEKLRQPTTEEKKA